MRPYLNLNTKSQKPVNKQNNSLPLYKKIEEMISSGKKDTGRLYHILDALKQGKYLYRSDEKYLDECLSSLQLDADSYEQYQYEIAKPVNKQNNSLPLYKKIEEMISSGKKDTGRLYHILDALKQGKYLYRSDEKYLDECLSDSNEKKKKIMPMPENNFLSKESVHMSGDMVSENIVSSSNVQTYDSMKNTDEKKYPENDLSTVMHSIESLSNKIEDLRKEYENGTYTLEHRDQTITSHIHSLNARFEDSKLMYEKSGAILQDEIKSLKSEVSSIKSALSSDKINLDNNFSESPTTKKIDAEFGTKEYDDSMEGSAKTIKNKIDSTQLHLNSLNHEVDKIFLNSNSLNIELQSTKSQLESVKSEYLQKESSAKKQIEQLTQTMKSQQDQLQSTKSATRIRQIRIPAKRVVCQETD